MRVLSSSQIREADAYTIKHEPIKSIDLMERASIACVQKILWVYGNNPSFTIYCGIGNNGGDGLAIARLLQDKGVDVEVSLIHFSPKQSFDNKINEERLIKNNIDINHIHSKDDLKAIKSDIVIDALVGTGLTRPLSGLLLETVDHINSSKASCIAIDLPSGMYCEDDNGEIFDKIIKADLTLSFQIPKLNFFFPDMFPFVGEWRILDIQLNEEFLSGCESNYTFADRDLILSIYKSRNAFAHKGTYGHALLYVGCHGKMGAAVLATRSCMKSGAGLVTAISPESGYEILQTTVPEVMVITKDDDNLTSENLDLSKYSAIGVGPGIGTSEKTSSFLKSIINDAESPLVIDADGINILSENPELLKELPNGSILTPHVKEFERLFGTYKSCYARQQAQQKASKEHSIHIVLKGKYTSITSPEGQTYFNNTGNPGMATAGSGDVLTGIITALLSQGYSPLNSCLLGCYLHGLSGDLSSRESSEESLMASDIIDYLGKAFKTIQE